MSTFGAESFGHDVWGGQWSISRPGVQSTSTSDAWIKAPGFGSFEFGARPFGDLYYVEIPEELEFIFFDFISEISTRIAPHAEWHPYTELSSDSDGRVEGLADFQPGIRGDGISSPVLGNSATFDFRIRPDQSSEQVTAGVVLYEKITVPDQVWVDVTNDI